jgi:hydrogenase 3 maturation protease
MLEQLHRLLLQHRQQILFVGIGNVLRSDDGAGVFIVSRIRETQNIRKLVVEVSIENYIPAINRLSPAVAVLVDCVDFCRMPGYFELIPVEKISSPEIHSHHITLAKASDFLNMPVWVLGIQPENLAVGEVLSQKVQESCNNIIDLIQSYSNEPALTEAETI